MVRRYVAASLAVRYGLALQFDTARERDRKLRESGATRTGKDRLRAQSDRFTAFAGAGHVGGAGSEDQVKDYFSICHWPFVIC